MIQYLSTAVRAGGSPTYVLPSPLRSTFTAVASTYQARTRVASAQQDEREDGDRQPRDSGD